MSLLEERPSFKEPSSPIGRVQSGLAASFLFESGNNEQANLPNNNINKGRWTEEEHKILMQEYEKYGNNCMQIAKVLSTQTPAQIRKHAECFFKQNLKTNSAAVKWYQESLSPDKKAQVLVKHVTEQQNYQQCLSPEKKLKFYAMMLMPTKNNASPFLLRKRSKFYKLMLTHMKKNESLFLLMTKTYL